MRPTLTRGAPRGAGRRGLTLVEVAIAAAVTSILGMLAYGVMMTTVTTQEDSLSMQERYHGGRVALERLRRELTMAFVSLHQAEDARTVTLFEGEGDQITFNSLSHEPLKRNAHQSDQLELSYFVKPVETSDGDRVDALVRRVKFHIDDRPGRGGREEVLVEGVRKLELEYYDNLNERWNDEWEVRIDDAIEMRARLQQFQQLRDQVDGLADSAAEGRTGAEAMLAGAAGATVAGELNAELDQAMLELMDGLFLPARVRVRLTLVDNSGFELVMETQVELPVTEPLWY